MSYNSHEHSPFKCFKHISCTLHIFPIQQCNEIATILIPVVAEATEAQRDDNRTKII